jgi:hypothetical protein
MPCSVSRSPRPAPSGRSPRKDTRPCRAGESSGAGVARLETARRPLVGRLLPGVRFRWARPVGDRGQLRGLFLAGVVSGEDMFSKVHRDLLSDQQEGTAQRERQVGQATKRGCGPEASGDGGRSRRLNTNVRTANIRSADERQDVRCPIRVGPVQTTSPLAREAPWASYPGCRARQKRATPDVERQYSAAFSKESRAK